MRLIYCLFVVYRGCALCYYFDLFCDLMLYSTCRFVWLGWYFGGGFASFSLCFTALMVVMYAVVLLLDRWGIDFEFECL